MTCFMLGSETLHQYCKRNNLCYQTMWDKLERGLTPEQAIKEPVKPRCNVKYLINGQTARSQMDINAYQRYVKQMKRR